MDYALKVSEFSDHRRTCSKLPAALVHSTSAVLLGDPEMNSFYFEST
jgi:hypothetical protein